MTAMSEPARRDEGIAPARTGTRESREPIPATNSTQDRIISGIDLIDYGVGGLYPDRAYLVKGGIGTGKSILGLQFLVRGLGLGEPGILITDQKPESVIRQAEMIGMPIEEPVRRGQLLILNPSRRYFELVESPADVMAILEELGDYIRDRGAKRLVVDPIYSMINTTYSGHFALAVGQSLMNALEELPVTSLLIAGDEENPQHNGLVRMLEQNAYGVVALSPDPVTGGRIMRLSKLRYASSEHLAAHYRILDGRGLMNYRGEGETVADVTKPWEEPEVRRSVLLLGASPETVRKVQEALGGEWTVNAETDMQAGLERVRRDEPGLVLVTPSRSVQGISTIAELANASRSSVAFLSSAGNRASDRVLYLRAGADDFITEPFSAAELRARAEALVRRSGRRLNVRAAGVGRLEAKDLEHLDEVRGQSKGRKGTVMAGSRGQRSFDREFEEKLQRSVDTVSKFNSEFALYWLKSSESDREMNKTLARLCRQEDVLCHNSGGEFVAILTGTDENGVRGFESRISEKLGRPVDSFERGWSLHQPGETTEGLAQRALRSA